MHSVVLHRVGVPIAAKTAQRVHMEVTDDGGWHAGAEVRIVGLVKTPQHNGKVGIISAKAPGTEGRVGVELGKGKPIALRRENLELVKAPQANGQAPETGGRQWTRQPRLPAKRRGES